MNVLRLQRFVRSSMWLLPIGCMVAGVLLALGALALDRATGYRVVPHSLTGTPSDAQTILSTFAGVLVSLMTIVLTVTLVAVLTLREIHGSNTGTVPGLSMLLSYALMLASIVVLVLFVNHAGHGLRVAGLIDLVGDRSREFIAREHGEGPVVTGGPDGIVAAEPGNVIRVDRPALVAAARQAGCVLELVPVLGDFVVGGAPLFRVHSGTRSRASGEGNCAGGIRVSDVTRHVLLAAERVHTEDLAYGSGSTSTAMVALMWRPGSSASMARFRKQAQQAGAECHSVLNLEARFACMESER